MPRSQKCLPALIILQICVVFILPIFMNFWKEPREVLKCTLQSDFYPKNQRDFIIMSGIKAHRSVDDINELLMNNGLSILSWFIAHLIPAAAGIVIYFSEKIIYILIRKWYNVLQLTRSLTEKRACFLLREQALYVFTAIWGFYDYFRLFLSQA